LLPKIDAALRILLAEELGYLVEPQIQSFSNLTDDQFPVCLFDYGPEVAVPDEESTIGFFVNNLEIKFIIVVKANEASYRIDGFKELSRFKKFINDARTLFETQFPDACILEMEYVSMEPLGMDNIRASGGIEITTNMHYRQSRKDPTSPNQVSC